jgi:predicted O-methyltransferase YrrM
MKQTNDIEGWFNHENAYRYLLANIPMNGKFLELGAWMGKSTSYLCDNAQGREIFVLDTWKGSPNELDTYHSAAKTTDIFEVFKDNMGSRKYIALRGESLEIAKTIEDESFDVVFIDLTHTYESVNEDIKAWWPKVKKGGFLAGDDYHDNWPGVKKAVEENFASFEIIDDAWIVKK